MSITVSDCLKLPSLRQARVVAGRKGLDHIIRSASVLEIFDDSVFGMEQPVSNSDLLLTSFSTIKDDYRLQCRHIENMYNIGDAALVIYYVGIYLEQIHPSLIETADRLGFPLIVMPEKRMDCFYAEVLSEVYDALFRDKSQSNNLIESITALVSRLPENRKNINTLLQLLSDNLKATILLSDVSRSNLSFSKWPANNEITSEEICDLYEASADQDQYLVETTCNGMPTRIFCVPFQTFSYRNFSLYIMDDFGALTLDDAYSVIEILQIFSKLWDMDIYNILENALVPAMIEGDVTKMRNIASRLGIDIASANTLGIIRPDPSAGDARYQLHLQREMIKAVKECSKSMGKNIIIDTYGMYIVFFVMYTASEEEDRDYTHEITVALDNVFTEYTITLFPGDGTIQQVRKSYLLYNEHIQNAIRIFPRRKVMSYGDILFAKNCYRMITENSEEDQICRNLLKPLLSQDSDDKELVQTLTAYYLDADCEVKTTARLLFIHRNTVQYRLNKIQTLINFRPDDRLDDHLLYTAAACLRLSEDFTSESDGLSAYRSPERSPNREQE